MPKNEVLNSILVAIFTAVMAFFDSTISYLVALLFGFLFNILAGFRADEVKVKITRLIPPLILENFNGNKFKDSLMELLIIAGVTYFLKGIADLMDYEDKSQYVVQVLIAIAIYYYFRNGLKNLASVYPKNKFIVVLHYLIAFKFRSLVGGDIADIVEKAEKETEVINEKTK